MINYSIIIPHYNRQDLLQRCLDSIPQRDDVEVIIVDDHSDPGKVDFANFPGLHRKNTTCIFSDGKRGKGPGYARNVGLEKAQGKWVIFVDSDDYLLPTINSLMEDYCECEEDVLYFKSAKEENGVFYQSYDYFDDAIDLAISGNTDLLLYWTPSPVCKFIKLDYIKKYNISFQQVTGGDDILFSIEVARNTYRRKFIDKSVYCVVMAPQSLTRYSGWKSPYNFTIASCSAYKVLKPMRKEKVPYLWICRWWKSLWKSNRVQAISLIPRLVQTVGVRRTVSILKKAMK